jgi:SNF2 family DNA or RNA helicase
MQQKPPFSSTPLNDYIKKLAPFSVIDKAKRIKSPQAIQNIRSDASGGSVSILAVVVENSNEYNTKITLLPHDDVHAECSCSTQQEMEEQWCPHALALLIHAVENNLLKQQDTTQIEKPIEQHSQRGEISPRLNRVKGLSQDFADLILELDELGSEVDTKYFDLSSENTIIAVDLVDNQLAIGITASDTEFDYNFFQHLITSGEALKNRLSKKIFSIQFSLKSLDNILINLLYDHGVWSEETRMWMFKASSDIDLILGILQEYSNVHFAASHHTSSPEVTFSKKLLDGLVYIQWQKNGLVITPEFFINAHMEETLPSDQVKKELTILSANFPIIGNNPFWTRYENTIYKLTYRAAKIALLFNKKDSCFFSKASLIPIFESLNEKEDHPCLIVKNPDDEPEKKIADPTPELTFTLELQSYEHFGSSNQIDLYLDLQFQYPTPDPEENIVYLPNRQAEKEAIEKLSELGFIFLHDKLKFLVSNEEALNIIFSKEKLFPKSWILKRLDECVKGIRFSTLTVNISLTSQAGAFEDEDEDDPTKESIFTSPNHQFDASITLNQNNSQVPFSSLFKKIRNDSDRWIKLDNGSYAKIPGGSATHLKTILGMIDPNFKLSNSIQVKLNSMNALSLLEIKDEQFVVTVDKGLYKLKQQLQEFKKISTVKISKNFQGELREYQKDGVSWLDFLNDFELGGILADEMGLGKTVQTLAFIQYLKDCKDEKKKLLKPVLIVAPTSVITNWWYEAKKFTPKLKTCILHGPQRKRLFEDIPRHDIVITSYALLRLDKHDLSAHAFSYIILDEAQNIKNPQTATSKAAKAIKSKRRVALSGTPTENRPMELWSIIDFLMPGYLGTYDFFKSYIEKPIMDGGPGVQIAEFLKAKTKPFILRRTKNEVEKDLPPKIESVLHVEMTHSQRELYRQILEEVRPKIFEAVTAKGVGGASISILAALLRLRQVCNHPNSIAALRSIEGFESGKFTLLKDIVTEALESGRKILVFSQFREMLSIIREWLETIGTEYLYLDGSTKDRQDLVDQFNSDEKVRLFLISLKAGGTGLNLTAADTVIIYDPWWNPAVESQAIDRAHRIGQKKTVSVYRLVTENSIEQKIMDLKEKKATIVDALINENGISTLSLSKGDLEDLFAPLPFE